MLNKQRKNLSVPLGGNSDETVEYGLCTVDVNDPFGTTGLYVDGTIRRVVTAPAHLNPKGKKLSWVSDCPVRVSEKRVNGITELTFTGIGAKDKRRVEFTMEASDLASPRKFKAAMINAFGHANRLGSLDYSLLQRITQSRRQ
jgi:hypothetical protein